VGGKEDRQDAEFVTGIKKLIRMVAGTAIGGEFAMINICRSGFFG
jgi:hypothetical protein